MAGLAGARDAHIDFVSATWRRNPLSGRADIVLVDSIAAWAVAPWLLRRPRRVPLAAILHQPPGGIDHGPIRRTAQARLDRMVYERCTLLVAASAALRDEMVDGHRVAAERIIVIAPGRDVAAPATERRDLRAGRRAALLSVGNWVARKGTLELLTAFAELPPELATLHLVGRDDAEPGYGAHVRSRLDQPDLRDRVVVHGAVSPAEVAILYANADVFVLPSVREPYGTVYGEAMAAGLPVVGWNAGNLPNLAEDGRHGVILEPGDVAGLADALRRLAADEGWCRQLGAAARARAASFPTWEDSADALFDALRGVWRSAP